MSSTRRPDQPSAFSLSSGKASTSRWAGANQRARRANLAARAGRAEAVTPDFEQLEARQLLFAIPITGELGQIGQVLSGTATFGYTIPLLVGLTPEAGDDPEVTADPLDQIDFTTTGINDSSPGLLGAVLSDGELLTPDAGITVRFTPGTSNIAGTAPNRQIGPLRTPRIESYAGDIELRVRVGAAAQQRFSFNTRNPVQFFSFVTSLRNVRDASGSNVDSTLAPAQVPGSIRTEGLWSDPSEFDLNLSATGTRIRLFLGDELVREYVPRASLGGGTPGPGQLVLEDIRRPIGFPNTTDNIQPFQYGYSIQGDGETFDRVEFSTVDPAGVGVLDDIIFDDLAYAEPPGRFAEFVSSRIFGAQVAFSGRVLPFTDNPAAPLGTSTASPITPTLSQDFSTVPAGAVATGTIFNNSRIQLTHSGFGTSPAIVGGQLRLQVNNAGAASLTFLTAQNGTRPAISATFSLPTAGAGSLPDVSRNVVFELVREGQVVDTLTTDELQVVSASGGRTFYRLAGPALGEGTGAFDTIRVRRNENVPGNPVTQLDIDDLTAYSPTLVEFFDLYGRPMRQTIALGIPTNRVTPFVDENDDGVPDFNDGIGRIVLSNSDTFTNLTIVGGTITFEDPAFVFTLASPAGLSSEFLEAGFGYDLDRQSTAVRLPTQRPTLRGLPPQTGSVIIGAPFFRDPSSTANYIGDFPGSITSYPSARLANNPTLTAPLQLGGDPDPAPGLPQTSVPLVNLPLLNFNTQPIEDNLDDPAGPAAPGTVPGSVVRYQGIYTQPNESVGVINVAGIVHGQTRIGGSARRVAISYLVGSLDVQGDVGQAVFANDVGMFWTRDQTTPIGDVVGADGFGPVVRTGSRLSFGRTINQLYVAGRNYASITVLGDVNNPARAQLDFNQYSELEKIYRATPPSNIDPEVYWSLLTLAQNSNPFITFNPTFTVNGNAAADAVNPVSAGQGVNFGSGPLRNESLLAAEYVGSPSGGVTINGELLGSRPLPESNEDGIDVYAFSADRGRTVTLNATALGDRVNLFNIRIVDRDGRTLANHQSPAVSPSRLPTGQVGVQLSFTPDATDVYYIVVTAALTGTVNGQLLYQVGLTGLTPTTAGLVSVGLNSPGSISINGSLGMFRAGVGAQDPDGADANPVGTLVNSLENARTVLSQRNLNFSVQGNVQSLFFGSSLSNVRSTGRNLITIGGNLGSLLTGRAQSLVGSSVAVGDVNTLSLIVGGSIGTIDVARGLGYAELQYNNDASPRGTAGPVLISTGTRGGPGDIGSILVGSLVAGDVTTIRTSAGSRIDRLIVGTVPDAVAAGLVIGSGINFDLGFGSDLRFVDIQGVVRQVGQTTPVDNTSIPISFDSPVTFTDDSGARFSINLSGGIASRGSSARVVLLPLGNGASVVGRLEVNLVNGANLVVNALDNFGSVSLGRVVVVSGETNNTRRSSVTFSGSTEIDILNFQAFGSGLDQLTNNSPNGDIVAADVATVNRVQINGTLGRTEVSELTSPLLGPFLGVVAGNTSDVGGAIPLPQGVLNYTLSADAIYTPFTTGLTPPTSADDYGLPFDPFLNGLVVRSGNVQSVQSNKSVGDVLVVGTNARIDSVTAAADGNVPQGEYEGIIGTVYAFDIGTVEVGSGLRTSTSSALADAGIFAVNAIQSVNGGRIRGATIGGVIIAGNFGATARGRQPGIGSVTLSNGLFDGAFIGSTTLDSFWISARLFTGFQNLPNDTAVDSPVATGAVGTITGDNSPLFRSVVIGRTVGSINLSNTVFDASRVEARGPSGLANSGTIGTISAREFRNSTIGGEPLEYRQSLIVGTGRLSSLSVSNDISDLFIDSVNQLDSISARNVTRLNINGVGTVGSVNTSGDLRSSTLSASTFSNLSVSGDIRSTTVTASNSLNASARGAIASSRFAVSGVGGNLTSLTSGGDLSAEIVSAGSLGTVRAGGDFLGSITTTNPNNGDLGTLAAGGSILGVIDVRRNIQTLQAGRDIGRRLNGLNTTRDRIEITGTLGTIQAGGQIYSDVRVGQTISRVQIGRVASSSNRPGDPAGTQRDLVSDAYIVAAGRIDSVSVTGDLGAAILSESGGIGSVSITDGSLRQSARVLNSLEVRGGDLGSLSISNGQLGGNVAVPNGSINSINVTGSSNNRYGSIGYEPGLVSTSTGTAERGDIPPRPATNPNGVRDGVFITAGLDIANVNVGRGIYESVIRAGRRLGSVTVGTQVSTSDATVAARRPVLAAGDEIGTVTINGTGIPTGGAGGRGLVVFAGLLNLGADNAIGGTGANADTVKSGKIAGVTVRGSLVDSLVLAGITAGTDGIYTGSGDDSVAPGLSTIQTVSVTNGAVPSSGSVVAADTALPTGTLPAGIIKTGTSLPIEGGLGFSGSTAGFTPVPAAGLLITSAGDPFRIKFSGPGQAFWDDLGARIILVNTSSSQSALTLERTNGTPAIVSGVTIVSTDDAGLRSLTVTGVRLDTTFGAYIDGEVNTAAFDLISTIPTLAESAAGEPTKTVRFGERVGTLTFGNSTTVLEPTTLLVRANRIDRLQLNNRFGDNRATRIDARSVGDVTGVALAGILSVDQSIGSFNTAAGLVGGRIRAGFDLGAVTVGSLAEGARISAGRNIASVTVRGDATDSAILAGVDLGTDATFDRYNTATGQRPPGIQDIPNLAGFEDRVGVGNLGAVNIQGQLRATDIAAGVSRGNSGFITGNDRQLGGGRSTIASIRVNGSAVGSSNNAQGFGFVATGSIGTVTVSDATLTTNLGNLQIQAFSQQPRSLRVQSLTIAQPSTGTYTATIRFNNALQTGPNLGDLLRALSITQVRNDGSEVALQGGLNFGNGVDNLPNTVDDIDYTIRYDAASTSIVITFLPALTSRDLVRSENAYGREGALPGPGLYRFTLLGGTQANALRSSTGGTLDGNADGFSSATGADNSTDYAQIGDAGDRLVPTVARVSENVIDYYGPVSLDTLMGARTNTDRLPTANRDFTVRGIIGDHPDHSGVFPQAADLDVYTISLRAGQVLRLGNITGGAVLTNRSISTLAGEPVAVSVSAEASTNSGVPNPRTIRVLNANLLQRIDTSDPYDQSETYLVRSTGTYVISVGPSVIGPDNVVGLNPVTVLDDDIDLYGNTVTAATPGDPSGLIGDYAFTLRVVDDGDSGFFAGLVPLDAGQLANVPVPVRASFNVINPAVERAFIRNTDTIGGNGDNFNDTYPSFVFTYNVGPDGLDNTADDFITGTNGRGITITRQGRNIGDPVVVTRNATAGVTIGTQGTASAITDAIPLASAFPTVGTVVSVNATSVTGQSNFARYNFQRLPGPDGVFGNTDDIVTATSVTLSVDGTFGNADDLVLTDPTAFGVNLTRVAAPGQPFNIATDIVRATSDSGDGVRVTQNAPLPSEFAGPDGRLGTADDVRSISRGDFTWTLRSGAANRALIGNGTTAQKSTDLVVGVNRYGTQVTRAAGSDGLFNTTDDTQTFAQAIGPAGNAGLPATGFVEPDVIHLNSGQPIAPGARYRVTLKLARNGGNIGLLQPVLERLGNSLFVRVADTRGDVQFGIFETTFINQTVNGVDLVNGTDISDALNVATTNNVVGYAGNELRTGQRIANAATGNAYGYDTNGDFYIEYSTPASQVLLNPSDPTATAAQPGTFAVYVQGAVRSDYEVEVVRLGAYTAPRGTPATRTQNILISTAGGAINWLEANPYTPTRLAAFDPSLNGFTGQFNGEDVLGYIVDSPLNVDTNGVQQSLVARLQRVVDQSIGLNTDGTPRVRISSNASDFLGQAYSTVYLSSATAPAAFTSSSFGGTFGQSQLVDPFNANTRDEAVVFTNDFNSFGLVPTQAGADQFIGALTAAVGRRIGELLGARITEANNNIVAKAPASGSPALVFSYDIMAEDSTSLGLLSSSGIDLDFQGGIAPASVNQAGLPARNQSLLTTPYVALGRQTSGITNSLLDLIVTTPTQTTQFLLGNQATVNLLNRVIFRP